MNLIEDNNVLEHGNHFFFAGLFRERTFFYKGVSIEKFICFQRTLSSKRYSWFSEVSEVENHISVCFSRIVSSEKTARRCCFAVDSENSEKVIEKTTCEEN